MQIHTLLNFHVYHFKIGNVFLLLKNPFIGEKSPPSLLYNNDEKYFNCRSHAHEKIKGNPSGQKKEIVIFCVVKLDQAKFYFALLNIANQIHSLIN